MSTTSSEFTWSGTYEYTAQRIERPASLDEAVQLVADSPQVHGLGTRHSFNDVADGPGILLDLTGLPTDLVVDAEAGTATFGAGTRYGLLAPELDAHGFALHNMGSLPHISAAGAIATGTHGSGTTLGSLSSAVRALEIVDAEGALAL